MKKKNLFQVTGLCMLMVFSLSFISCKKKVTGVEIDPDEFSFTEGNNLFTGSHIQFQAIVYPENARDKSVTWISSNPVVASIDNSGYMLALSEGKVYIICKTNDGNFTDTCRLHINKNHIEHVKGVYKGNVLVNDTATITDVILNMGTTTQASNSGILDFKLNDSYLSCVYKVFLENGQYKIKGFIDGNANPDFYAPAISCKGVFDDKGSAYVVFDIKTEPMTHLVFTGEKKPL
jgi:hypothetical protein